MILQTKLLKEALQKVAPAHTKSPVVPILNHVIINSEGTNVKVILSNMAETIETNFKTNQKNEKETILPNYLDLFNYVKLINEVDVELNEIKGSIEIKAGKAFSRINGESKGDYPKLKEIEGTEIKIETDYLFIIKEKILPFASTDELKPFMTGAMMRVENGKMILEATDGHQLARIEAESNISDCKILFRRAIPEIAYSLFESEFVSMFIDGSGCRITDGNTTLKSRLLEEQFPDTNGVLPPKEGQVTRADRKIFLSELQKAKLFVHKEAKEKAIQVSFSPNRLGVSAKDTFLDRNYENKMEVEGCRELEIGLEVDKVIKAAQKIEGDTIEIHHYDSEKKMIKMVESNYFIITMPCLMKNS